MGGLSVIAHSIDRLVTQEYYRFHEQRSDLNSPARRIWRGQHENSSDYGGNSGA